MDDKTYGYLIVTENSHDTDVIARDYWHSLCQMKQENQQRNLSYVCLVLVVNGGWFRRFWLSYKTGIPMKKIKKIHAKGNNCPDLSLFMAADSLVDQTYWGFVKVYDRAGCLRSENLCCATQVDYES